MKMKSKIALLLIVIIIVSNLMGVNCIGITLDSDNFEQNPISIPSIGSDMKKWISVENYYPCNSYIYHAYDVISYGKPQDMGGAFYATNIGRMINQADGVTKGEYQYIGYSYIV